MEIRLANHFFGAFLGGRKDDVANLAVSAFGETVRIQLIQRDGLAISVVVLLLRGCVSRAAIRCGPDSAVDLRPVRREASAETKTPMLG